MSAFLAALFMVTVAEIGDKTQLLAMAFATRYKAKEVLLGVFIATIFNHALAVLFGEFLTTKIPTSFIQLAAAFSFIGFGLWTLRGDELDDEDKRKSRFGPIGTVAIAFFIAELGDKTQLATIALAAKYHTPLMVLAGTTIGMMIADALGIWGGTYINNKVPDLVVKAISAGIFIVFGVIGIYTVVPKTYINPFSVTIFLAALAFLITVIVKKSHSRKPHEKEVL